MTILLWVATLLVDSTQRTWIIVTALIAVLTLGAYFALDRYTPGGLSGGSTPGLWFGVVGTGLMIYAGLLSAHRKTPRFWWWMGPRRTWLKGHIWLGLLSVVFILCHASFRLGGPLERILWLVFALTILTGIVGLWLQQFLPRLLTLRAPEEVPYEQIPHVCTVMREKGDEVIRDMWKSGGDVGAASIMLSQVGIGAKMQLQEFYEQKVRPFLNEQYQSTSPLARSLQAEAIFARLKSVPGLLDVTDQIQDLKELCDERRSIADQERLHQLLHAWLLLHIPLSVALLVVGLVHIVTAIYY